MIHKVSLVSCVIVTLIFSHDSSAIARPIQNLGSDQTEVVLDLFRKSVRYSNEADWEEYVGIASDDMKRVWLLAASTISFAPEQVATEFRRQFEHDRELSNAYEIHAKGYVFETSELNGDELDHQYASRYPNDQVLKVYRATNARLSAYLLEFEFIDQRLVYMLRYYGSLPRLYYESEPTKVEISGNDAIVFAKARMPKKFFGSVGGNPDTVVIEPIPVYFKRIDGTWKLSPFPPTIVEK